MFLDFMARKIAYDQDTVRLTTCAEYLEENPVNAVVEPSPSSWGDGGYSAVWVDGSNDWIYRHVHRAEARMQELARRFKDGVGDLERRALNQAARELMLAQSSDWTFIMKTGTTVPYATRRINEHILQFTRLYDDLSSARVSEPFLNDLESRNNLFPHLDYRIYAS
jgi:1,4-alpha-glucan branching enzyme